MSKPSAIKLEDVPGGPISGTRLCSADEIPDGGATKLLFSDGDLRFEMFIQRRGTDLFAYKNSCPHARLPLDFRPGKFLDFEKTHLYCVNHGAHFRLEDGFCVRGPCKGKYLHAVDIRIDGDAILSG